MRNSNQTRLSANQKREAKAIRECLSYLEEVSAQAGFHACAHLIGLAAESTLNAAQVSPAEIAAQAARKASSPRGRTPKNGKKSVRRTLN